MLQPRTHAFLNTSACGTKDCIAPRLNGNSVAHTLSVAHTAYEVHTRHATRLAFAHWYMRGTRDLRSIYHTQIPPMLIALKTNTYIARNTLCRLTFLYALAWVCACTSAYIHLCRYICFVCSFLADRPYETFETAPSKPTLGFLGRCGDRARVNALHRHTVKLVRQPYRNGSVSDGRTSMAEACVQTTQERIVEAGVLTNAATRR